MRRVTFAVDIDGTITENGGGRIHLEALSILRHMARIGHNVVFVSGRSSVEGFLLSVFGGTTSMAVGENGGCITTSPTQHIMLGDKKACMNAFDAIKSKFENVREKDVFPRLTEVVLERTFDIKAANKFVKEVGLDVDLSDSQYAFHINSSGINKGAGLQRAAELLEASKDDIIAIGDSETDVPMFKIAKTSIALGNSSDYVKAQASIVTCSKSGDGIVEAMDILAPKLSQV